MKQISSAYASVASLYMTDLSDEPGAEQNCEAALKEALQTDSENIDALQTHASLRMVRSKDDEAKASLIKVFNSIQKTRENIEQGLPNQTIPSIDFRL